MNCGVMAWRRWDTVLDFLVAILYFPQSPGVVILSSRSLLSCNRRDDSYCVQKSVCAVEPD
ncbi:unnamed protein product [Periconia digitata]|uniref:Uncharacterized protein n=1 Tax=Periconia digitata TaxID=1303443 RepID=A0A9W4U8A9_9PLEO|nr:unnamed protein product [Periconia digitata]